MDILGKKLRLRWSSSTSAKWGEVADAKRQAGGGSRIDADSSGLAARWVVLALVSPSMRRYAASRQVQRSRKLVASAVLRLIRLRGGLLD
jgi:hypothetical protein